MIANKETGAETSVALKYVPCIWYQIQFQEGQPIRALIDSGSKVYTIIPAYATKLGLTTQRTSIGAQKIDSSSLETYSMVSASFSLQDSQRRV